MERKQHTQNTEKKKGGGRDENKKNYSLSCSLPPSFSCKRQEVHRPNITIIATKRGEKRRGNTIILQDYPSKNT